MVPPVVPQLHLLRLEVVLELVDHLEVVLRRVVLRAVVLRVVPVVVDLPVVRHVVPVVDSVVVALDVVAVRAAELLVVGLRPVEQPLVEQLRPVEQPLVGSCVERLERLVAGSFGTYVDDALLDGVAKHHVVDHDVLLHDHVVLLQHDHVVVLPNGRNEALPNYVQNVRRNVPNVDLPNVLLVLLLHGLVHEHVELLHEVSIDLVTDFYGLEYC